MIGLLLSEPNADDGLDVEVTEQYKHDRSAFDAEARRRTAVHATGLVAPPVRREEKRGETQAQTQAPTQAETHRETETTEQRERRGAEASVAPTSAPVPPSPSTTARTATVSTVSGGDDDVVGDSGEDSDRDADERKRRRRRSGPGPSVANRRRASDGLSPHGAAGVDVFTGVTQPQKSQPQPQVSTEPTQPPTQPRKKMCLSLSKKR